MSFIYIRIVAKLNHINVFTVNPKIESFVLKFVDVFCPKKKNRLIAGT